MSRRRVIWSGLCVGFFAVAVWLAVLFARDLAGSRYREAGIGAVALVLTLLLCRNAAHAALAELSVTKGALDGEL